VLRAVSLGSLRILVKLSNKHGVISCSSRLLLVDHLHHDPNCGGAHGGVVRMVMIVVVVMVVHVVVVQRVLRRARESGAWWVLGGSRG
jgi:hypothetical protein